MKFCSGCGAVRAGGTQFCLHCGEACPVQAGPAPSQFNLRRLTWAGPLPVVFFFLPWITVSCQGGGPAFSLSGWELAGGTAIGGQKIPGDSFLFSILVAAILFVAFRLLAIALHGKGVRWLPIVKIVTAAVALLILFQRYLVWSGEFRREGAGILALHFNGGFFLTILAFVTAGIGALFQLQDHQQLFIPTVVRASPTAAAQNLSVALIPKFCPQCGTRTTNDDLFCIECGHHLA